MNLKQDRLWRGRKGGGVRGGGRRLLSQGWGRRELPRGQEATGKEAAQQKTGQKERLAFLMSQPPSLHLLEPTY